MAAAGCNNSALQYFGLQWIHRNNWRGCLSKVSELGLPWHTAPDSSELLANDHIISSLFGKADACPQRRLVMAFDRTYMTQCSQLALTTKGHVMVGGPRRPNNFDLPDESQLVMKAPDGTTTDVILKRGRILANDMEACVVWDCTRKASPTLEIAAFPCTSAAEKDHRFEEQAADPRKRGNWQVLCRIGAVLEAAQSVKHVIADAHGSHLFMALWMQGLDVPLSDELKSLVPFFSKLRFQDLPLCCFPIGARIAFYGQDTVHWWPGLAHCQKNFVEQLRSSLGTIHFGTRFVDESAALELGLVPCAYVGTDTMSDKQAALWFLGSA